MMQYDEFRGKEQQKVVGNTKQKRSLFIKTGTTIKVKSK